MQNFSLFSLITTEKKFNENIGMLPHYSMFEIIAEITGIVLFVISLLMGRFFVFFTVDFLLFLAPAEAIN